jgi:predicted DNA-binding transcriptional regulator AlpA
MDAKEAEQRMRLLISYSQSIIGLAFQENPDGDYAAIMLSLLAQEASEARSVSEKLTAAQENVLTRCEVLLCAFEELQIPFNRDLARASAEERDLIIRRVSQGFKDTAKKNLPFVPTDMFAQRQEFPQIDQRSYSAPPKAAEIFELNRRAGNKRTVTVTQMAHHTGVSTSTIKRMVNHPDFPPPKPGTANSWDYEEAKAFATERNETASGKLKPLHWTD